MGSQLLTVGTKACRLRPAAAYGHRHASSPHHLRKQERGYMTCAHMQAILHPPTQTLVLLHNHQTKLKSLWNYDNTVKYLLLFILLLLLSRLPQENTF